MKTVIKGFIHYRKPRWDGEKEFEFFGYDLTDNESAYGRVMVQAHEFEVELPDDFDPRPQQVQALEKEMQKVRADFAARVTEIERQISTLTCLEAA
jgi:hypothetical protein